MKIIIETIPHSKQRYDTVGDWEFFKESQPLGDDKEEIVLQVHVSDMGNTSYEALVGVHEVVEALLCQKRGITEKQVSEFDKTFEEARTQYPVIFGDNEPGDHPKAPYHNEHEFASRMEHSLSMELGVDWQEYNKAVNGLSSSTEA